MTGPDALRSHAVEVNLRVRSGQLEAGWTYSRNLHEAATVELLAEAFLERLRALVASCRDAGAAALTPSDFPDAALSPADLARLLASPSPPDPPHEIRTPGHPLRSVEGGAPRFHGDPGEGEGRGGGA